MAGHSQFKNIMHRKGAQDAKRAKKFTKLVREIYTAAKLGIDPNFNAKLRNAIDSARAENLPKDRIEGAIKKASDPGASDNFEEIRYEGFGPGGIALIIEALSDNRNRTVSDVRSALSKYNGQLGETGSVNFMFKRIGFIIYSALDINFDEILEASIEAGADDVLSNKEYHEIITSVENFHIVKEKLKIRFNDSINSGLTWRSDNITIVHGENAEKLYKLIDALEDSDDIQNIYGNYEFTEEFLEKMN